jgi:hypothetical protein
MTTAMTTPDHTKEGLLLFSYTCDELGVELACWFEYEAASRGARSRFGEQLEPDYPATWALYHVYLPNSDIDIAPVLSSDVAKEIEGWVADQAEEDAADREWNDGYDKFQDWKDAQ